MGPDVEDDETVDSLGLVPCTVGGTDNAELTIEMEDDLTTTGEWGDELMTWNLDILNPTDQIGCTPTVATRITKGNLVVARLSSVNCATCIVVKASEDPSQVSAMAAFGVDPSL